MKIIFELSKEFEKIPIDEVISCLIAEKIKYNLLEFSPNLLIISSNINEKKIISIANRLALTYYVGELLFISSIEHSEIISKANKKQIKQKGSIAIRYKNRSNNINSQIIIELLAKIYTKDRYVDLINPKIEIRCLICNDCIYVYKKIKGIDRSNFEKRKAQFRPFFSPISLNPKLSRVMINLSMIKNNEILLDPFCGTGGILIEAGLLGYSIIGNDIEKKLIDGCRKNLDYYNIKNYKLLNLDIGKIKNYISEIDVIVTDLPYGKSTTTKGESIKKLYDRTFSNIDTLLKKKGKAIVGLNKKEYLEIAKNHLYLDYYYSIKVHNSLTRYLAIFTKK